MPKPAALLIVFVLWALLFLPGLGTPELKGEEGRRILPALAMLETGDWLVPHIGGEPYLRKPPLLNWAIAGVMRLTDCRSEWAARLPSVLAVLAVALTIVALAGKTGWLSVSTALVAAVIFLTQIATFEKGRLAEIEALYFGLSGLAIVWWLAWWGQERSPWLLWLVPGALLGLGWLTKGPLHLLFFYAIVLCVVAKAREWRALWHPAHFLGLVLMAGIFAAWWVPYQRTEAGRLAVAVLQAQSVGRMTGHIDWGSWALNLPRGLSNHLPWLFFAPLLWRRDLEELPVRERAAFRGLRLAVVGTFAGVLLVPGMLPRYTLPLLAPFAVLLGAAIADERLTVGPFALRWWWRTNTGLAALIALGGIAAPAVAAWSRTKIKGAPLQFEWVLAAAAGALALGLFVLLGRRKLARTMLLALGSGMLAAGACLLYTAIGLPWLKSRDRLRPAALRIDTTLPADAELFVFDVEFQPALFYVQTPISYVRELVHFQPRHVWLLTRGEKLKKVREARPEYGVALDLGKPTDLILLQPGNSREYKRELDKHKSAPELGAGIPSSARH